MIKTISTRDKLKQFVDKKVHVKATIKDFATGKYKNSLTRRPTILFKNVVIVKGSHEIHLDHLWIMPNLSDVPKDLYVGDEVEFDGLVYKYKKVSKKKKDVFIESYGIKDISNFEIAEYANCPTKGLEDIIVELI